MTAGILPGAEPGQGLTEAPERESLRGVVPQTAGGGRQGNLLRPCPVDVGRVAGQAPSAAISPVSSLRRPSGARLPRARELMRHIVNYRLPNVTQPKRGASMHSAGRIQSSPATVE